MGFVCKSVKLLNLKIKLNQTEMEDGRKHVEIGFQLEHVVCGSLDKDCVLIRHKICHSILDS